MVYLYAKNNYEHEFPPIDICMSEAIHFGPHKEISGNFSWANAIAYRYVIAYIWVELGLVNEEYFRPKLVETWNGFIMAFASNYTPERIPSEKTIEKIRTFVGWSEPPRWYIDYDRATWRLDRVSGDQWSAGVPHV